MKKLIKLIKYTLMKVNINKGKLEEWGTFYQKEKNTKEITKIKITILIIRWLYSEIIIL